MDFRLAQSDLYSILSQYNYFAKLIMRLYCCKLVWTKARNESIENCTCRCTRIWDTLSYSYMKEFIQKSLLKWVKMSFYTYCFMYNNDVLNDIIQIWMNVNLELITATLKHRALIPMGHLTVLATLAILVMEWHVNTWNTFAI